MNFSAFNYLVIDGEPGSAPAPPSGVIQDPAFQDIVVSFGQIDESVVGSSLVGSPWSFGTWTGVAADGSDIAGSLPAPAGVGQAAFIRAGNAPLSQEFTAPAGVYTFQFDAAWGDNASKVHFPMRLDVRINGSLFWVSPFIQTRTYNTFVSPAFALGDGTYEISFLSDGGGTCAYTNIVLISNALLNSA